MTQKMLMNLFPSSLFCFFSRCVQVPEKAVAGARAVSHVTDGRAAARREPSSTQQTPSPEHQVLLTAVPSFFFAVTNTPASSNDNQHFFFVVCVRGTMSGRKGLDTESYGVFMSWGSSFFNSSLIYGASFKLQSYVLLLFFLHSFFSLEIRSCFGSRRGGAHAVFFFLGSRKMSAHAGEVAPKKWQAGGPLIRLCSKIISSYATSSFLFCFLRGLQPSKKKLQLTH